MDANLLLWIAQILLALVYLGAAYGHTIAYDTWSARPNSRWMTAIGREPLRIIGSLEVLGAIGLILPSATRVLPWLTPVAATCFVVLMAFAIAMHARRGETPNIVFTLVLGVIAAVIAYGRFVVAPV